LLQRRKPLIAAVSGYALGGGCELALMCDFIYCADNAKFGLPEVTLGVIPGIGGTQRLTLAIGKAKAMEMCLTARQMGAVEAEQSGLVAQVFPKEELVEKTLKAAEKIAEKSVVATMMIKESINRAFEVSLQEGLRFERRTFHSIFATQDQKEGMQAFVEKRQANFKDN
jgi:Enoyl-CoA hydratase/carnithine racemase